ncbi:hypothetical protein AGMMS49531_09830 [Endomicrobiia bacterium]|nr:hypothetical protein AGMMS49531_09830 [Endomicrobiia bacterium]
MKEQQIHCTYNNLYIGFIKKGGYYYVYVDCMYDLQKKKKISLL